MTQEPAVRTGQYYYGTGRRKCAIARVRLYSGSGTIEINGRPYMEALPRSTSSSACRQPLEVAEMLDKFDIVAKIEGGGITGWADALTTAPRAPWSPTTRSSAPKCAKPAF